MLTGNPQHLLLILIAWLLAFGFRSETDKVLIYGLGLLGSFVLFSALLRCEPWNARYRLAFFALRVALVGVVIPARLGHTAATALSVVLILAALPYALSNDLRPLLGSAPTFALFPRSARPQRLEELQRRPLLHRFA